MGLDDVPMKTRPTKAQEARERAQEEIEKLVREFCAFMEGKKGPWLVPSAKLNDRLDVKSCLPRSFDIAANWEARGLEVLRLDAIVDHVTEGGFNPQDHPTHQYTLLRVLYEGVPIEGEVAPGRELTYK